MPNKTKAIVLAQNAKEIKGKFMLSNSFINSKQLLQILQKTPQSHIYTRKGKGAEEFDYVTGAYIKKVLNYTFGWNWDFEIKEHGKEGNLIWVLGRLTIRDKNGNPRIIKEQFGRADVKFYKDRSKGMVDFGNDLKAAATDSLKKCASELGIASDVYGKEEFKEIVSKGGEIKENVEDKNKVEALLASEQDMERIYKLAKELGLNSVKQVENKLKLDFPQKMTKNKASQIYAELLKLKILK